MTPELERVLDAVKANVRAEEFYAEDTDEAFLVEVSLYSEDGLTFKELFAVSKALGTDRVNLLQFGEAAYGSSWTGKYANDSVTIEILK